MAPERWREIDRLYQAAVELEGEKRAAFLDEACGGDSELRSQVEAMLRSDAQAGNFMEVPAIKRAATILAAQQQPGSSTSTVGHYRILERLGVGGMGVVYKAQDINLGRFAALKFLPETFAHDRLAVDRFRREARVASALDHPNICTIYEIGDDQGRPFIAMQYLEGQTLKQRIERKPLATDELFDLAIQITSALESAHSKGIIHRDIKPANIFITNRGEAKVLDFGLAKLTEPRADLTELTATGSAMGTAAYMSPEQARGEPLDARSDLFSFGAVLYEMATGRQAFSGATAALIHSAILHRDPEPPSSINPALPHGFDALVLKALEKDRDLRCQSAAELRADLKRLKRDTDSGRTAISGAAVARARKRSWRLWAAIAAITAVLAIAWFVSNSGARHADITERQLTSSFGSMVEEATISPDGSLLAYGDQAGLHLKTIDSGEVHDLPWLPGARIFQIAWFPSNHDLLVGAMPGNGNHTNLWKMSLLGGAPKLLREGAREAAVSWDGSRIAFVSDLRDSIWAMSKDGEDPKKLISAPDGHNFGFPQWSPGDKVLLYTSYNPESDAVSLQSLYVDTGQPGLLSTPENEVFEWLALRDGRMLYLGGLPQVDSLYEVKANLTHNTPIGEPRLIRHWPSIYAFRPSVSADGKRFAFIKRVSEQTVFVAEVKNGGKRLEGVRRLVLSGTANAVSGWMPDGSGVIYQTFGDRPSISRQRLDSTTPETLLTSHDRIGYAASTPDGKWIYYVLRAQHGEVSLMRMAPSGGLSQVVWSNPNLQSYRCATAPVNFCVAAVREKTRMVFYGINPGEDPPPGGFREGQLRELHTTDYGPRNWGISPDGSELAMIKPERDRGRIHIVPLPRNPGDAVLPPRDVIVKGWADLFTVNFAYGGNGWYVSNELERTTGSLLYVDPAGNATVLNAPSSFVPMWAAPSPDGKYLAFTSYPGIQNAWMIEGF